MTNDLTTAQNAALVSAAQVKSALARAQAQMPVVGGEYMRFTKGDWTIGIDHRLVTDDNVWVVAAHLIQSGYVCWSDTNQLLGKVLRPLTAGEVDPAELPSKDGRWDRSYAVQLRCIEGPHAGAQVTYETSSDGGQRWFAALTAATLQRMEQDDKFFLPVVVLGAESYQSKRYGRQVRPSFEIVDWANVEGDLVSEKDTDEDEDGVEAEPEPVRAAPSRVRTRPTAETAAADTAVAAASETAEKPSAELNGGSPARARRRRIAS